MKFIIQSSPSQTFFVFFVFNKSPFSNLIGMYEHYNEKLPAHIQNATSNNI